MNYAEASAQCVARGMTLYKMDTEQAKQKMQSEFEEISTDSGNVAWVDSQTVGKFGTIVCENNNCFPSYQTNTLLSQSYCELLV